MSHFAGEYRGVALRLLAAEGGECQDPEALAAGTERALQKLRRGLGKLIGPMGFHTLLTRALTLAQADFPFLRHVQVEPDADDVLRGLGESVLGRDPDEARESLVAILANFIGLLASFIGDRLALHLAREIWPTVQLDDISSR
ncbi:MAG: hypothetical protein HY331_05295 [Chloroflexi bacterium]|nr:hypothetical protein [Chloroflexota bacterium]